MDQNPLISVLMTAYNREKYIAEAIGCVLKSTYKHFELIIVDDCSTDSTVEIARSFAARDNRIQLVINKKNLGQFLNRNKASDYAKGEYIYYADSDDQLLPDGLENLVTVMLQFPESGFAMYHPQGETIIIKDPQEAITDHFFKTPFLTHGPGGTFIKRKFFNNIGRYSTEFGIPGDMYFNLKAAANTRTVLIPFKFMNYRMHEEQELSNKFDYLYNNYKYMNAALNELPLGLSSGQLKWLHNKNKRRFVVNIYKYFMRTGNLKKTGEAIRRSGFTFGDALKGIFH